MPVQRQWDKLPVPRRLWDSLGPNPDGACRRLCDCGWGVLAWSLSCRSLRSEQWLPLLCNSRPLPRPPTVVVIAETETFSEDRTSRAPGQPGF